MGESKGENVKDLREEEMPLKTWSVDFPQGEMGIIDTRVGAHRHICDQAAE